MFLQRSAQASLKRMGLESNTIHCTLNTEQMHNWPYCVNQWVFQNLFKDIYMIKLLHSTDSMKGWRFAPRVSCRSLFEVKSSRGHWKRSERRGMHQMVNILKVNSSLFWGQKRNTLEARCHWQQFKVAQRIPRGLILYNHNTRKV